MTTRAWLVGELAAATVFAVPTLVLTLAGARHVAFYGEAWGLYVLSAGWLWGPALLLAGAALLQGRAAHIRRGWAMSVVAAVAMSSWSVLALSSFARQGDVHWSLWAMWFGAAAASTFTIVSTVALAPSRRPSREGRPVVGQ
jgi:hypothetical protein